MTRSTGLLLAAAFFTALGVRGWALESSGFAEDEIEKLHAAEGYLDGRFSADAEHPMLLKLAVAASIAAARAWNASAAGAAAPISDEASVRLPGAMAGALTVFPLFVVAWTVFGRAAALAAAWLWALDITAIAINRTAKEDTLFVFFFLSAIASYEYARSLPRAAGALAQHLFTLSGVCFGLMLASKYLPHYLGLHALYRHRLGPNRMGTAPARSRYLPAMGLAFLAANFAVVLPETWSGIAAYLGDGRVGHTGYAFAGTVYSNRVGESPFGIPIWFYLTMLATKVPLPVLGLGAVGAWGVWRDGNRRAQLFTLLLFAAPIAGYSLVASKFVRYMLPSLALLDVLAAAGLATLAAGVSRGMAPRRQTFVHAAATSSVVAALVPGLGLLAPFYGLYENRLGRPSSEAGLIFPHCELYDAGLREAARFIALKAAWSETVLTDAPQVVREYLIRYGRADLAVARLSSAPPATAASTWTLVQPGRMYLENLGIVERLQNERGPTQLVEVGHHLAVGVYREVRIGRAPLAPHAASDPSARAAKGAVAPPALPSEAGR